jgi:hypothetical protein
MGKTHGALAPGKVGNVVIWSGDPLELSSKPEAMFIRGKNVDPDDNRQRALVLSQFTRRVDLVEPVLDEAFSITGAR